MKTKPDPSIPLGPTPKSLFKISITVYVLLLAGMISGCLLVNYPLSFQGSVVKTDTVARQQDVCFLVPKLTKLSLADQITFQDLSGQTFQGTVTQVNANVEPTLVTIRVNLLQQRIKPQFNTAETIQLTSSKKLLFVLLAKLS